MLQRGTVNDLAMAGAKPAYLSAGFVLEGADDIRKKLRDEYKLVTARDFGELQGKFFRICHIGNFDDAHMQYGYDCIRKVLNK